MLSGHGLRLVSGDDEPSHHGQMKHSYASNRPQEMTSSLLASTTIKTIKTLPNQLVCGATAFPATSRACPTQTLRLIFRVFPYQLAAFPS